MTRDEYEGSIMAPKVMTACCRKAGGWRSGGELNEDV
jgi:hypothetical protein